MELWSRLTDKLRQRIAPAVPANASRCEFDCRRINCAMGRYEHCKRRIEHMNQVKSHRAA